jgi:hypothetical protein
MTYRCQVGAFLSLVFVLSREHPLHDGKARQGVVPATATVDHADIRVLATTLLVSVEDKRFGSDLLIAKRLVIQ